MTSAERKSGGRESITDVSLTCNEWKRENVKSQRKKTKHCWFVLILNVLRVRGAEEEEPAGTTKQINVQQR